MKNSSKIGKTPTYKIELHVTTQECNELVELLSRIGEERISKYEAMEYINMRIPLYSTIDFPLTPQKQL